MAVNHASRRVMEKSGLRFVRTFHLTWDDPIAGTEFGEVEYALDRGLSGDGSSEAGATLGGGDELDAGAAARFLAEDTGYRVGQPGNQSGRDLAAVGARQGRLADAERDRWCRVIDSPSADAPASERYAVEIDHHEVAGPLAVHLDDGIGQAGLHGAERARRLAQLIAVTDVLTWKLLRHDRSLSRRQTELALIELLQPLTGGR